MEEEHGKAEVLKQSLVVRFIHAHLHNLHV